MSFLRILGQLSLNVSETVSGPCSTQPSLVHMATGPPSMHWLNRSQEVWHISANNGFGIFDTNEATELGYAV